MRFRTLDELDPSMEGGRTLLQLMAFGGSSSRRSIDEVRRRFPRWADYVALFATESDRVLGQVFVLRFPYVFRSGPETVSGLAAVTTRPDRRRTGIARALLDEVHRREREAGVRFSTLWTNPSWGAHALYESLGYRDVYSAPWALSLPEGRTMDGRTDARVRAARPSDLSEIELLHDRSVEDRLGFGPRPRGFLRALELSGRIDAAKQLLVLRERGKLLGYAHVDRTLQRIICGELVAATARDRRRLIAAVVALDARVPVAFQHSVVTEAPEPWRTIGFLTAPRSWWGLMAAPLNGSWTAREAAREFATADRRFVCYAGDRF